MGNEINKHAAALGKVGGSSKTPRKAAAAYDKWAASYFGKFAKLNNP